MKNIDKYRGCMIGGAVGDALGYPIEFMQEREIFESYGSEGLQRYQLSDGVAEISDDTQMSMFTATGLLLGTTRGMTRGIMRVAPIGIYLDAVGGKYSYREIQRIGAEAAALTHGHEFGYLPAAVLLHIVSELAHDPEATIKRAVCDAAATMQEEFPDKKSVKPLLKLIDKAVKLAEENIDDLDAIHQLGEGWVAEETLAIAIYCSLRYRNDFRKAVTAAVNHRGDSDSTGAVTGNIVGTYLGLRGIPEEFTENLELRDVIQTLADLTAHFAGIIALKSDKNFWFIRNELYNIYFFLPETQV